ncbi:molybdopterin-synthase adenylyltransferase MoeB [Methylonatrum kenyense]|uniref:molybdopterin-synthase adenylyltransferase MoeB n=1 Tax=Methylonatrum kenyense TaxID=455253 RepID=UPI0020BE5129|nr:molybdopterin-synthase adenylyltransferase MoeB [Methylonatrum kenyense]
MSSVIVRIPTPLRGFVDGRDQLAVDADSVEQLLERLAEHHLGLVQRILTPEGELRPFVNLFVDNERLQGPDALRRRLVPGQVVSIIPAVAGGGAGSAREQRLSALRASIPEIEPEEACRRQQQGAVLLDVRDQDEVAAGSPDDAVRLGRSFLELRIEDRVPDLNTPLMVLCGGGTRSLFAAEDLLRLGYAEVSSVSGGFNRWKNDGLPFEVPRMLDATARDRYSRHLLMPEVGEVGQLKLADSRVLLIGAGGLGSPAALYLAAAGVGTLGIVDHDVVDRSNLQRQIIHADDRVGMPKAESARQAIHALNPDVRVELHREYLDSDTVDGIFPDYDLVIDGTDNFATRYLINDACIKHRLPNVHGAVFRFEGQVSVFWPGREPAPGPCYRCLFPEPPPPELAPSCSEAGVLGVLPGVIGLLQAVETVKLLLDVGEPLVGRLLFYDALAGRFQEMRMERDPECAYCGDGRSFPGYVDYQQFCRG